MSLICSSRSKLTRYWLRALQPHGFRFETDLEPSSSCRSQTLQGLCGWPGSPALQPGDNGLGRIHPLRKLLLRKAGGDARIDDRSGKLELRREIFISLAVFLVLHP